VLSLSETTVEDAYSRRSSQPLPILIDILSPELESPIRDEALGTFVDIEV